MVSNSEQRGIEYPESLDFALIPQQSLQLLFTLLAERDHRFLLIVELQGVAIACILNDGLYVVQFHQVGEFRALAV